MIFALMIYIYIYIYIYLGYINLNIPKGGETLNFISRQGKMLSIFNGLMSYIKEIVITCQKTVAFITNHDMTVLRKTKKNRREMLIWQIIIFTKPL